MSGAPIFRSDELIVRQAGDPAGRPAVVTFDCYGDRRAWQERAGFGADFFARAGIPAIHIVPAANAWYQHGSIGPALEAARAALAGASRVLAYGSSMGGYAAIRFADRVGADAVLALSPQYSIDPAKARFETRWLQESRAIGWRAELDGPIRSSIRPVLVYDDCGVDRRHARLIARDIAVRHIRVPHGAHPVGTVLLETGMLQTIVMAALDGTLDTAAAERAIRARLSRSPTWWGERAHRAPWWRRRRAVGFAVRAVALDPDNPLALHRLAVALDRVGRHDESRPLHDRAATLSNRDPGYLRPHSFALAAAGDIAAALALAREICAADPAVARNHQWEAWLLGIAGDRTAALAAAGRAVALDPDNRAYAGLVDALRDGRPLSRFHPRARRAIGRG